MFFGKKPTGPVEYLIVGLGNPGKQYEGTRHNAGFAVVEALEERLQTRVNRVKFQSFYGEAAIEGHRVLLLKPQTFMNNSGEAVREAMRFYKLTPDRVIVLFDDIALPVGQIRVRRSGSAGGQKGMASIIQLCGSDAFMRVRVGVGAKPHPDYDLADWVLSRFSAAEAKTVSEAIGRAAEAAEAIVTHGVDAAMNRFSK